MKIRVLVVDDSAFMRKVVTDILKSSENIEVVDTAKNGQEAVDKVKLLNPDVVTLDVEMPVLNGIDALRIIMRETPTPVLMLSSLTVEGAEATLKSLELGAVDFIPKPSSVFKVNTETMKAEIIEKVVMASKAKSKMKRLSRAQGDSRLQRERQKASDTQGVPVRRPGSPSPVSISKGMKKLIAIGTSTGGPRALQMVIPTLPGNIEAGIVLVQHMPAGFTKSLAERLNAMSEVNVKEAENGDVIKPGWVYLAPGGFQMRLDKFGLEYRIKIENTDAVSGHKPSVDALMNSIADLGVPNVIGVIMTGMGSDGAKGLVEIKNRNKGYIIAQDEESCVVFGMPKSTIELGVVDKVASIEDISYEIMKAMEV